MSEPFRMPAPKRLRVWWSDGTVAPEVEPGTTITLAEAAAASRLEELYAVPAASWTRMNMLGTLNARVTGPDGTSDSISNRADRAILKRVRAMSDAVLVGASTLRQERHTATGATRLIVVTASGDLHGHRIAPDEARAGVTVLCPPEAASRATATLPGAEVAHPEGSGRLSVAAILGWCHGHGLARLVVEGGASLIGQFLDADAIDEVCLTQAPVFGPGEAPSLPGSTAQRRFRRALLASDDLGYVYSRLVAERD